MKLWGGRFTKETNELVNNFNASISFDQKFYKQDIEGSIAHATMLGKQGIIPENESEQIVEGLKGILADIESGKLEITDEYEDIHTFMEATLIERIGDAGKRLSKYCVQKSGNISSNSLSFFLYLMFCCSVYVFSAIKNTSIYKKLLITSLNLTLAK